MSTNADAVGEFGIDTDNMFGFWDWGRGALLAVVGDRAAADARDRSGRRSNAFSRAGTRWTVTSRDAPLAESLPVTLALLTVWYTGFRGTKSHLVAPYEQYLHRFPAYLQQLTMESNGETRARRRLERLDTD